MNKAAVQRRFTPSAPLAGVFSDARLTRQAVKGDERAFGAIFHRYHQSLYRFCLAIVGNPEDAQDALQNTMVKVLRALPGEERAIDLKPWLYRIAHNESIELLRRRRETRELDPELAGPGTGLAEEVASRERLRGLLSDLDELPERQRGALLMRELVGLDFAEIGEALGTSPAVVRQTIYEARLSLRQMDEGREMSCEKVTRALSDGDGRITRRRDVRSHLRSCAGCRRFQEGIEARERDFAALSPLPAVAAMGLLHSLLGSSGAGGGGLAGAVGAGMAKTAGASTALKGAATIAAVAAIGVTVADRGGLIDAGLPGHGDAPPAQTRQHNGFASPARAAEDAASASRGARGPAVAKSIRVGGLSTNRSAAAQGADGRAKDAATATGLPVAKGASGEHPHGRGHEKQHPSAAAYGQQSAADHKAAAQGQTMTKQHPVHPPKPLHPATSTKLDVGKGSGPASSVPAHEALPQQPAPPLLEEAPTGAQSGNKP